MDYSLLHNDMLPLILTLLVLSNCRFYVALALLGLPYYMYVFIWHYPVQWNLCFKGRGVEALSVLCFPVSKVLQAVVLIWWMIFEAQVWPQDLLSEMQRMSVARLVLCASLSLAGNIAVASHASCRAMGVQLSAIFHFE